MKKSILSIAVIASFVVGCKKDDDNDQSRSAMMAGTWNISQYGFDANGNGVMDNGETTAASPLTMSGSLNFNSNGTVISNIAAFGFPASIDTAQWALINNDNYLRTISEGDTTVIEIKNMSSSSVTLRDTSFSGAMGATWMVLNK